MKNVIFVAPYFMDATSRFIDAATKVENARIGLVSCDPAEKLEAPIRDRLAAHFRVGSIETSELQRGVEAIRDHFGGVDRLLGMLEQIQEPLGEIRERLGIEGVDRQTATQFRDKSVMKTVLQQNRIPCARHRLVHSLDEASQFANESGFPLIVKPPDGAGAKGTYRCESNQQLNECVASLSPSGSNPVLLEQFMTGEEFSFDSVFIRGEMVWYSISAYRPRPLDVVREPWIQWCVLIPRDTRGPEYDSIRKFGPAAVSTLGLQTGLSHMEWFRKPDGSVAISEVGARPPGAQIMSLMSYAHSIDMYHAWADLMIHDRFATPSRDYACGAAYLRGMGQGKVVAIDGVQEIASRYNDLVVEAKLPKPGQTPSSSYEGDGYVIVRHPETEVAERALKDIVSNIQVRLG